MPTATPPERKPLISGNWKMNHNHFEAIQTVQKLSWSLTKEDYDSVEVSIHPPFTDLRSVQTVLEADHIPIALGAQHCHSEPSGAFTGEVSAPMLAKLNVRYVIAGHSERRELFGETDEFVNAKVHAILEAGMLPILCVGETLGERDEGTTEEKVRNQVRAGLRGVSADDLATVVVAYEPIWAIGTGRTASPDDAQAVCAVVRDELTSVGGESAAGAVRIQYGGSVKPENAAELMAQTDIDGALVGGASLDPDQFAAIIRFPNAD
ncbi:MAG TPA: triose-phosphate isomerase [Acidimicrobiales bacterium]|nr:triose-phosphate isomerase [Acidimicrobiales bacterium]